MPILARHTSKTLDDLVIIPTENSRPSVIITHSKSPVSSTPFNSPPPEEVFRLPSFSYNPEISSIEMTPPPVQQNPLMDVNAAERNVYAKYYNISSHIFMFNANKLHKSNLHLLDVKRKELDEVAFAFFEAMQLFRHDYQLTAEKLAEINTLQTSPIHGC